MKKVLCLLIVSVLALTMLVACSSGTDTPAASGGESMAESMAASAAGEATDGEVFEVVFLPTDMSLTFASWLAAELELAFSAYDNMELTILDSKNELETQISNLENSVAQGYDYIILLPIDTVAENDIVAGYIEDGVPIMNINLDDGGVATASSVVANPFDLGTVVAETAKAELADDANVVVLLGPSGNIDSIERRRAYEEILFSQTNITILDEQLGDWDKSRGLELMENWIQVHGEDIDAVISMNDAMAIGAYEAAKAAGLADDMLFYGVDGLADAVLSIEAGELTATALQDAKVMAEEAARIVNEVLTGENTEGFEKIQIPVSLITMDNVAEYVERYQENGMIAA